MRPRVIHCLRTVDNIFPTRGVLAQLRLLVEVSHASRSRGKHAVSVLVHERLDGHLKVSRLGNTSGHSVPHRRYRCSQFVTLSSIAPLKREISTSIFSTRRMRSADVSLASTCGAADEGSAPVEDVSAVERLAAARRASSSAWAAVA